MAAGQQQRGPKMPPHLMPEAHLLPTRSAAGKQSHSSSSSVGEQTGRTQTGDPNSLRSNSSSSASSITSIASSTSTAKADAATAHNNIQTQQHAHGQHVFMVRQRRQQQDAANPASGPSISGGEIGSQLGSSGCSARNQGVTAQFQ